MNRKRKGQRKELLASHELEKEGWTVFFRSCTVKRGPCFIGLDFADCVDLVAGREDVAWLFVSCTHAGHRAEKIAQLRAFKKKYQLPGMNFQVWAWNPARWTGRGRKKAWNRAHWEKTILVD